MAYGRFWFASPPVLAVGAPVAANGGSVTLFELGTTITRDATFTQADIPGMNPESGDQFGAALAAGDIDGDGISDLAIGSPGENSGQGVVAFIRGQYLTGWTWRGEKDDGFTRQIFGDLAKVEYFGRFAAANGDGITPMLVASAQADDHRTVSWTKALVQHLVTDRTYGDANRAQINAWIAKWDEHARRAVDGFAPCFSSAPARPVSFTDAAAGVWRRRDRLLAELGLRPSGISRQGGHV